MSVTLGSDSGHEVKAERGFSMLCINEDTHIYCAVLRGKTERSILENEAQKKHMLDVVVTVSDRTDLLVLAYCILDNELHVMMKGSSYEQMRDGMKQIRDLFQKMFLKGAMSVSGKYR